MLKSPPPTHVPSSQYSPEAQRDIAPIMTYGMSMGILLIICFCFFGCAERKHLSKTYSVRYKSLFAAQGLASPSQAAPLSADDAKKIIERKSKSSRGGKSGRAYSGGSRSRGVQNLASAFTLE